jgi:hypothetical protein
VWLKSTCLESARPWVQKKKNEISIYLNMQEKEQKDRLGMEVCKLDLWEDWGSWEMGRFCERVRESIPSMWGEVSLTSLFNFLCCHHHSGYGFGVMAVPSMLVTVYWSLSRQHIYSRKMKVCVHTNAYTKAQRSITPKDPKVTPTPSAMDAEAALTYLYNSVINQKRNRMLTRAQLFSEMSRTH